MSSPSHRASPAKRRKDLDLNERTFKFSPVKQFHEKLYTKDYFCHYSNAIYMGGMDCFKKLGHGIMLMDNGTCALTCHSHDNMINHNVIFREGSITSLLISIDKSKTVCFRTGPFLLYFKMSPKEVAEGIGYFIHYSHRKIFRLKFQNEDIAIKQRIVDIEILKSVFDQNDLTCFMEKNHANAVKMEFDLPPQIKCSRVEETYVIGLVDASKTQNYIHGVCFKIHVRLQSTHFDLVVEERGFVKKNTLQVFGERHFENGNYYIGEFKNDEFHGLGVLVYPKQNKWTYGEYEKGQLQKVLASSVNNQSMTFSSAIKQIHQYSKPYIEFTIKLNPSEKWLYQILKAIDEKDPYEHESIDYTKQENKLAQNLNIVQEDYVARRYELRTEEALKNLADKKRSQQKTANKNSSKEKLKKFIKQSEKKENRNQFTRSPETRKGKFLNDGGITFAPKDKNQDDIDFRNRQPKTRSRSRSRSNEKEKQGPVSDAFESSNKTKTKPETQVKNETKQPIERIERLHSSVTPQEERTFIQALTREQSNPNRFQTNRRWEFNPLTPTRSEPKPLYNNFVPEVYTRYNTEQVPLYYPPRYDSPTRRIDLPTYTHVDLRLDPKYRISPERQRQRQRSRQRYLPVRYRPFRYLPDEEDDIYLYPRMSNRAYFRDAYRF